ncbi:MAG TPA: phosphoribosylaminoimidazolesuccinocarboxamide synthase, partial [Gemmatales bacterium]|nr:phosphoribosylaminoimidazolesuccinocarboxamide synthase [Gemmatales bacterium]
VARGYLAGSGWKEYQTHLSVCGIPLPAGLFQGSPLPEPLFTPATKAETGHDENISFEKMSQQVGSPLADKLRETTLALYRKAADYARTHGILLADTKFEFGIPENSGDPNKAVDPILIDEVLTPDSSRYWPLASYQVGSSPVSFDKQFLRDWLETTPWDKNSPPPALPVEIVHKTREKYIEAYEKLTGRKWDEVLTTFCT